MTESSIHCLLHTGLQQPGLGQTEPGPATPARAPWPSSSVGSLAPQHEDGLEAEADKSIPLRSSRKNHSFGSTAYWTTWSFLFVFSGSSLMAEWFFLYYHLLWVHIKWFNLSKKYNFPLTIFVSGPNLLHHVVIFMHLKIMFKFPSGLFLTSGFLKECFLIFELWLILSLVPLW